ncbi:hypothetical protein NQZ68_020162 [Dissostichus eleginoides]|nr:hypothetical protein NQZ68_020162 [Dissostichus eleginoides]
MKSFRVSGMLSNCKMWLSGLDGSGCLWKITAVADNWAADRNNRGHRPSLPGFVDLREEIEEAGPGLHQTIQV